VNRKNVVVSVVPLSQRKSMSVTNATARIVVKTEIGHLCFMRPLRNKLPSSDSILFVFYDFETTQDTKYSDSATVHVPNLVCLQQFRSKCENIQDIIIDREQCGRPNHTFWDDPVGDLLTYL